MNKRSSPPGCNRRAGVRCAIYTRKSSEEGLEQAFNSLDAQRETCEAYVFSQKHEGWMVLPQMYDDGGFSGGSLDRPSLKRLLADIAAGMIDTIVVYKVNRLTRSLSDFAKIVEVFERHGVTFVSVTQSFNTTTSMGRLTLNMLLSFAQFERELAGERIRDKIAASKRKGMWMGGLPPLGYDIVDRKLVINGDEAEIVRHIFRRYAALGSVRPLKEELDSAGILSKCRLDRFGRESGGKSLARGALYLMLQNRIYRGEIVHKQASYPGEHEALIDEGLWNEVHSRLVANRVDRQSGAKAAEPSLLAGLMYDEAGERMTPTHANKRGRRYRYYVSHSLIRRGRPSGEDVGRRLPAGELESAIEARMISLLGDAGEICSAVEGPVADASCRAAMIREAARLAASWSELAPSERRSLLQRLIERIEIRRDSVTVAIRRGALLSLLAPSRTAPATGGAAADTAGIVLTIAIHLRRVGKEMRLLIAGSGDDLHKPPDRSLLRLLGQAYRFQDMAMRGNGRSIGALAEEAGVSPSYFTRVLKLSFLSPKLIRAILEGRQPSKLNGKLLTRQSGQLARDWALQADQLGIH